MRFVLFSDLHIHGWTEFAQGDDRLLDCVSVLSEIRAYCVSHKINRAFFGGDMFHVKGTLKTKAYALVAEELKKFKDAGIEFYAAVGNHDHEDKEGDIHALQPLMAGGLIKGVGAKGWRVVDLGDCSLVMFSYCDDRNELARRIKRSSRHVRQRAIALFHHGFKGARVGSTLEYVVKEPIDAKELKLDKRYELTFSGHYHAHQRIEGIKHGFYIGSPLEHTRSDRGDDGKGFLVVDTSDRTFERVQLDRPRFLTCNVDDEFAKGDARRYKGNFVDVVYSSADERLDTTVEALRAVGARGINPVALASAKQLARKRLNVSPTSTPKKVLRRYVKFKRRELKRQKLDRGAILRIGVELLREQ